MSDWIKNIFATDWLHKLLKKIDYNRYTWAWGFVVVCALVSVLACQPKATSPYTQQPATESQIAAQAQQFLADQAQDRAQLEAEMQARLAELDAQRQGLLAHYQGEVTAIAAQAQAKQQQTEIAMAEIDAKKELWAKALATIERLAVDAAGPYGGILGIGFGLAASGFALSTKMDKARADAELALRPKAPQQTAG